MQIKVRFLDNLKVEALFDDHRVLADQPVRYKGNGLAPSPFDYFLASSALCAAYFVKMYCRTREIPLDDIRIIQNNIVDPDNRYKQDFKIDVELPNEISEKDRKGILASIDRCSVKRVIQNTPNFIITPHNTLGGEDNLLTDFSDMLGRETFIPGKDRSLEESLKQLSQAIKNIGVRLEIASWRNPIPHVWSVHLRDADCPINYTNGKGQTKEAALCSALGEFIERLSTNYFYADYYLGEKIANAEFVHYPDEKWFSIDDLKQDLPSGLMDDYLKKIYSLDGELKAAHLIDTNSGNSERGICALPFIRQSDQQLVYIPVNLIGNLFVSNGMSAGNTKFEARVQALSEIFERAVKNQIISEKIALPEIPENILSTYPQIQEGIQKLKEEGFTVFAKDASLSGRFPVCCVAILNPQTGGGYASFGAHPIFEVALERSLTELLQGRSFESLKEMPKPSFHEFAITEHNNLVNHFIDSSGVLHWRFFSSEEDYSFYHWDFSGTTQEEFQYLMEILNRLEKDVYIADYNDLGIPACRILVPNYSEIYEVQDLLEENNNQCLSLRKDILNLHTLDRDQLSHLVDKLESSELDDFLPVMDFIGVAFDENSPWGKLMISELKCLIYLILEEFDLALENCELITNFNEYPDSRIHFYGCLKTLLEIEVSDEFELDNYFQSVQSLYPKEIFDAALLSLKGEVRFYGLLQTDLNLTGIEKHRLLIQSYDKLRKVRKN